MSDDVQDITFAQITAIDFNKFFWDRHYNGKNLKEAERVGQISMMDGVIAQYTGELPMLIEAIEESKGKDDAWSKIDYTIASVSLFVIMTMADIVVTSKYFLLADKDYDKRVLRGKLMVILNEGFKKLYGFNDDNRKESEWARLESIMEHFPEIIILQQKQLTSLLEDISKKDTWWKNDRNVETHMDAEGLYASRSEEIVESKVMMDSMRLFDALLAVIHFLKNVQGCVVNFLVAKYYKGELKDK